MPISRGVSFGLETMLASSCSVAYQFLRPLTVTHSPVRTQWNSYREPFLSDPLAFHLVPGPPRQLTLEAPTMWHIRDPRANSSLGASARGVTSAWTSSSSATGEGAAMRPVGRRAAARSVEIFMMVTDSRRSSCRLGLSA